jgi:hypothetical protein
MKAVNRVYVEDENHSLFRIESPATTTTTAAVLRGESVGIGKLDKSPPQIRNPRFQIEHAMAWTHRTTRFTIQGVQFKTSDFGSEVDF